MNKTALIIVVIIILVGVAIYELYPKAVTPAKHTTISPTTTEHITPISAWSADAYTAEVQTLLNAFSSKYRIPVLTPKGGGSFGLAHEICIEGNKSGVTVFVPVALGAVTDLGKYNPGWAIAFVADHMAIAYTTASINNNYAKDALNSAKSGNWSAFFQVLSSGKVSVGISNPNVDPAGFRAWIVLEMAGYLYHHNESYYFNRMLYNRGNVTEPNAADFVSALDTGHINFLFIYESAAIAKNLEYIKLPNKLNLGCVADANFYYNFTYKLNTGIVHGEPVYLFITIPKDTSNYQEALQFVVFTIENSNLLSKYQLTSLHPALLFNSTAVPPQIAKLISEGYLKVAGSL